MRSAFGIDHGEISKLSGYDYTDKNKNNVVANRVGWTESDTPGSDARLSARYAGKKAGRVMLTRPSSWKKKTRQARGQAASKASLDSWKATSGGPATPGKYTEQVWEHKNLGTKKKSYSTGMASDAPYRGKYRTWDKKNPSKAAAGYKVAR